jgi:sugar-specific transcriptional regulator TrmB
VYIRYGEGKNLLVENEAQLFTNLGLTYSQAKVYLTVVNLGETTAKTIAATAKMDRPDVYRVLNSLIKEGFIEKQIEKPVRFKAFPIDEVIEALLKRKQEDILESKRQALEVLRRYQNRRPNYGETRNGTFFYSLIPGNPEIIDKTAGRIISNSQTSIEFVCVDIEPHMIGFLPLENFLKNGGKDRILAYNKNTTLAQKVLDAHKKGAIEIRFTQELPIVALIGDKKEVAITCITSSRGNLKEMEGLYTNSPAIIKLASDYFERLWKTAERFP